MGDSDLYYTSFGLRALAILDELDEGTGREAARFLQSRMHSHQSVTDFFSLIYSAALLYAMLGIEVFADADPEWDRNVARFLNTLRRDDGGFAKAPEGHAGSTYHTFLVVLVMQLIGEPLPDPDGIAGFLRGQRAESGGFREIRAAQRGGTNPTAAAIATLKILDRLDAETVDHAMDFLLEMQTDEGGLRANTRIPVADALSTFTGMLTIDDLGEMHELEREPLRSFVNSLELPGGGFRAAAWDEAHDVEYTFYGLGCMALLENDRRRTVSSNQR
jgi:geranylgeranyl transferase type-2 subunit beta